MNALSNHRPVWRPTKQVLFVEYLISSFDAKNLIRKLTQKKNAKFDFYFDVEDTGLKMGKFISFYSNNPGSKYFELSSYKEYGCRHPEPALIIRVYRDVLIN